MTNLKEDIYRLTNVNNTLKRKMEDEEFSDCWPEPSLDRVVQEFDVDYVSSVRLAQF